LVVVVAAKFPRAASLALVVGLVFFEVRGAEAATPVECRHLFPAADLVDVCVVVAEHILVPESLLRMAGFEPAEN
jgi:hypothetical protein